MTTRARRLVGGDDRGFAVVLGAMILLGMGVIAFTTYKTAMAPDIESRSEARQMATVADRLAEWVASVGQGRPGEIATGVTTSLPLEHDPAPLSGPSGASTLSFQPAETGVRVDARNLSVLHLNGSSVQGTEEVWRSTDDASLGEISSVDRFRLRVEEIDSSHTGESVTVDVTDADGDHVGDLRLLVRDPNDGGDGGQGFELVVRVRGESGDVLYDQPILISSTTHDSHSDPISPYWVNLLNEDYEFGRVLAAADPPFQVDLQQDGLDSDYSIDYVRSGSTEEEMSGGRRIDAYNRSIEGGILRFRSQAQHAEDETLTVEHGALVRSQDTGATFVKKPAFSASLVDHTVHVNFAWPSLTGGRDAASSGSGVLLDGVPTAAYSVRAQATNLTVNVTTEHPGLWQDRFAQELEGAGLTDGRGFSTATGADWARADIWGLLDPAQDSKTYDLSVDLRSVETEVRLGG